MDARDSRYVRNGDELGTLRYTLVNYWCSVSREEKLANGRAVPLECHFSAIRVCASAYTATKSSCSYVSPLCCISTTREPVRQCARGCDYRDIVGLARAAHVYGLHTFDRVARQQDLWEGRRGLRGFK